MVSAVDAKDANSEPRRCLKVKRGFPQRGVTPPAVPQRDMTPTASAYHATRRRSSVCPRREPVRKSTSDSGASRRCHRRGSVCSRTARSAPRSPSPAAVNNASVSGLWAASSSNRYNGCVRSAGITAGLGGAKTRCSMLDVPVLLSIARSCGCVGDTSGCSNKEESLPFVAKKEFLPEPR